MYGYVARFYWVDKRQSKTRYTQPYIALRAHSRIMDGLPDKTEVAK